MPWQGFAWWHAETLGFALSNNARLFEEVDGRPIFIGDSSEFLETLEYLHEFERDNIVPGPITSVDRDPLQEGKVAMAIQASGSMENVDFEYSYVPFPKGPNADKHIGYSQAVYGFVIPITTTINPRAIIEIINAMYLITDNYKERTEADWLENLAAGAPDRESYEVFQYLSTNTEVLKAWQYLNRTINMSSYINDVLLGNKAPAQAMAELKPMAQAALDELFGTE